MGVDACIYIKTTDGLPPTLIDPLPHDCDIDPSPEHAPENATHEIVQLWRYYAPNHERGSWPTIAATLMALFAAPNVETVWYFGDIYDPTPFTRDRLLSFTDHYMTRP